MFSNYFIRLVQIAKKQKTYTDFVKSQYFNGFIKFASYCIDLKVDDVDAYVNGFYRKVQSYINGQVILHLMNG